MGMGNDFVFINVKEPKDALQLAKEPEIRSHLARRQWQQIDRRRSASRRGNPLSLCLGADCPAPPLPVGEAPSGRGPPLTIPPPLGGLRVDPFRSYPIAWRPYVPLLVDHYLVNMAVDIPELDQPGNRGLLRCSWFPLVMTEPALFLVILLLSASHYASVQTNSMDHRLNLLNLRWEAVRAINNLLVGQPPDAISDALLGAIAKMASYEAMFGSMDTYRVHMEGLSRAVALRGGLASLGLNGLLRRIVVWIDRNAAFLHGTMLHFPGATFASDQPLPDPNPGHFLGAS
ncbi:hypothetical protein AbraIFM66950_006797 [Aspergillus brasiliensis]|nr:hypothetical protein AbraIFM66950_006797 [Aspergillus brasiliensis]